MSQSISSRGFELSPSPIKQIETHLPSPTTESMYEIGDLLVEYLKQLNIEYVYGVPGGAIEPLYNALARSERLQGPRSIVARHESGAVFMADGYHRNSGKLGVCCTTTGPGATNAITGVAVAYENDIPLLLITAQTAMSNFGKKALQESADTGVNTVEMYKHCTRYSTMVSHIAQFETKLVTAVMTAFGPQKGPVHLSIPLDILRTKAPVAKPSYNLPSLIKTPSTCDIDAVRRLCRELLISKSPVFVLGSGCYEAIGTILHAAHILNARIITTSDGKGLVSPYHPLFRGVVGFAGHQSATDLLANPDVDLVVAVGTTLGEWSSNGWDKDTLLNSQLIHIDPADSNLTRSPMARLHVRGRLLTVFEQVAATLVEKRGNLPQLPPGNVLPLPINIRHEDKETENTLHFKMENPDYHLDNSNPIKPQWLMSQLTNIFPPNTKYVVDSGNSFAWATHYLHPFDRRSGDRRLRRRRDDGRRHLNFGLFQAAIEFSSMGWAIGSAIGAAMASPNNPTVCITGDGSWLMSGQEITTAVQENIAVIYIILNDAALGMVKHGQKLAGAEPTGFTLPLVNFRDLAVAVGADGYLVASCNDLLRLDINAILARKKPCVIDIRIDPEQVPPMGLRMKVLQNQNKKAGT